MATFTLKNSKKANVDSTSVLRVLKRYSWEAQKGTKTHIDVAGGIVFVMEELDVVVNAINAELDPDLVFLTAPNRDKDKIWFQSKEASGPYFVPKFEKTPNTHSAFDVGGKRQWVRESHQEVYDLIKKGGGNALPIPDEATLVVDTPLWETPRNKPKSA